VKAALEDFTRRVLTLFPDGISQIILYGSYARGKAAPDSDVDVMVVVKFQQQLHNRPGRTERRKTFVEESVNLKDPQLRERVSGVTMPPSNDPVVKVLRKS
jgi:predicted nucleotidyltransferase